MKILFFICILIFSHVIAYDIGNIKGCLEEYSAINEALSNRKQKNVNIRCINPSHFYSWYYP